MAFVNGQAQVANQQNIQSNILAYESLKEYGFCRIQAEVDNSAGTMELGSVLVAPVAADKTVGTFVEVTGVTATDGSLDEPTDGTSFAFAIIIGTGNLGEALNTSQADITTTGTDDVMLLVRGEAMVRKPYLVYQGTQLSARLDAIVAYIEGYMDQVIVVDSAVPFDGSYGDVTSISN